jgi:quercetin 2,3-dioxygenase
LFAYLPKIYFDFSDFRRYHLLGGGANYHWTGRSKLGEGIMQRHVERLIEAQATSDGGGVKLNRFIGTAFLDHVDPFMLFDEFRSDCADDYIAGFPNHPHRGIETVTYMLAGSMLHQDHLGHEGRLDAGCVQWMSAGRGIIHSEMPQQIDGLMWGFQLWINLPRDLKMSEPHYRDIPAAQVPHLNPYPGVELRLIAGRFGSHLVSLSPSPTQLTYLDVKLDAQTDYRHPLTTNANAFLYVFAGDILVDDKVVQKGRLALTGSGDEISLRGGQGGGRCLLIAGQSINEPIARYGPFVMNTKEEIIAAIRDYQEGRF